LLRDLNREFGSLGLAAAAYNAGPGRVRDWLGGRRPLPGETRAYVRLVTGRTAEEWAAGQRDPVEMPLAQSVPCSQVAVTLGAAAPGCTAPPARKSQTVGRGIGRRPDSGQGAHALSRTPVEVCGDPCRP